MKIKDMFAKKIDREIQGVIIVGQGEDANVSQELGNMSLPASFKSTLPISTRPIKRGL